MIAVLYPQENSHIQRASNLKMLPMPSKIAISKGKKKISPIFASTSNYQLELVIGTYPTFNEQRNLRFDFKKHRNGEWKKCGICIVWKKAKLGILSILLPIFCQLHEDISKLFIVRIFLFLVLKTIPT